MTAVTSTVDTTRRPAIASHLAEFRAALEQQRVFRTEQLVALASPDAAGSTDAALDEVTDALRAGATNALCEIEAAIARMEAGRYGPCETCREQIPLERLEILPMAQLCMRCAHARELRTANREPMIVLAAVTVVLLVVAAVLFVGMFRRDDPMLGLVALVVALGAASSAVLYGGVDSL